MGNLTALAVKNAKPGDKLGDGGGLRLDVDKNGNRSWVFRYTSPTTGKERYAGFGSASEVTLADARDARDEARKLIRAGQDPIEHRNTKRTEAKVQASRSVTFKVYASPVAKPGGKTTSTASNGATAFAITLIRTLAIRPLPTSTPETSSKCCARYGTQRRKRRDASAGESKPS
jgi:Arm domain-containing DNA-binding protein